MSADSQGCSFFSCTPGGGTDLFLLAGVDAREAAAMEGVDWDGLPEELHAVTRRLAVELAHGLALHLLKGALVAIGRWIHGDGNGKPQGVMIRSYVAFWDLLPSLARLKQTDLAEVIGLKHKQSVGREVSDFRDRFGWRNGHMQCEEAREACRKREARKVLAGRATEEGGL